MGGTWCRRTWGVEQSVRPGLRQLAINGLLSEADGCFEPRLEYCGSCCM